jgi:heme exporter protein D
MTHDFYVYSSWGISVVVLILVIGAVWYESGRLQRELKRLEAQGIRRRSAATVRGDQA